MRSWAALAVLVQAATIPAVAATIQGRVVEDRTGSPVPSANVTISQPGARNYVAELETDSEGTFDAPNLPAGDYRIEISRTGFLSAQVEHVRLGASFSATVRLARCGVIAGRVMDTEGKPIKNVQVELIQKSPSRPGQFTSISVSDDTGRYRLYNLAPGQYELAATPRPRGAQAGQQTTLYPENARPQVFQVSGGEEYQNVDFTLRPEPSSTISGRLDSGEFTAEKPRFFVALVSLEQPGFPVNTALTQPDGSFTIPNIPNGTYRLLASNPEADTDADNRFVATQIQVGGNVDHLQFEPKKGRTVKFTLTVPQATAACTGRASLVLTPAEFWLGVFNRISLVDLVRGQTIQIAVPDLPPTAFSISMDGLSEGCYTSPAPPLDLRGSADPGTVAIALVGTSSLHGRVDAGGQPSTNFQVILMREESSDLKIVVPGTNSQFSFDGLAPGRYRIAAVPLASTKSWIAQKNQMFEVEIRGGQAIEMDLAASAEVVK